LFLLLLPTDILLSGKEEKRGWRFESGCIFGESDMYVIGIDVGTSGTKALLLDRSGDIVGQGYQGYNLYRDGKCIEQDAEDWWKACIQAVRQAVSLENASMVAALSLSTQGASMVALNGRGEPIGRAITWLDTRAQAEADKLSECLGDDAIYHTTGWRSAPYADAPKIIYMKDHKHYRDAKKYCSTIEFINLKLTGNLVIDPTNAAIRQLFNINTGSWDAAILSAVGITEQELPVVSTTGQFIGALCQEAAAALGLPVTVKVYNGAHDQYCASIGSGSVNAGDMLVSTGTTWVLMGISEKPIFSHTFIAPCSHPLAGLYGNMVSLAGAGSSFQWIADNFLPGKELSKIDAELFSRVQKNAALFFIPWLSGAAYPFWNPLARGGFVGMDFTVGPYDMALAIMESAVFSLKMVLNDFKANGFSPGMVRIMGGAVKSDLWMNMLAAVIDLPIHKMKIKDSCALGAAFIAACGEGWYGSYAAAAKAVVKFEKIAKTTLDKAFYREKFQRYTEILTCAGQLFRKGGI
jgi:sugar (pentulose or hexulose) kinase